ncbi:MAG TPA: ABC transporter substrate-binding protein [Acidimicrobiales bacterium]|nr:ABC transporter substrate-binding protein [Acidimicrobiales bacterium]
MVKPKTKAAGRIGVALTAAALVAPLISVAAGSSASAQASFPRNETLYTSGTAGDPPNNFNPNDLGSLYTGTYGLLYEPLFLYDPIHGKYLPWLAASGGWKGSEYIIHLRPGVDFVSSPSGTVEGTMTGNDVAFSIDLAKDNLADPWNSYASGVKSVSASGLTVTVQFSSPPPYTAWQDFLWQAPILPASSWSKMSSTDQMTTANMSPVATGPMLLDTTTSTQACFSINPHWWGTPALGLKFAFKYLCDEENSSNNQELSNLLANQTDWDNNFLPGISALVNGALGGNSGYGIKTYYPTKPYMLSANTVWLDMNTTKAPMSNVDFRKAVAYAIDTQEIQSSVYTGMVQTANPTGLLPNLDPYVSKSVVSQYGFSYNPSLAKKYLKESGYKGQKLTIEVPDGWTDWMAGIDVIAQNLNAIGINVTPEYPQYATRESDMIDGTYDMALDNNAGIDASPWSYFDRAFNLPILAKQSTTLNWARYSDPKAWALVQEAGDTPSGATGKLDSLYGQLEQDFLQALPDIPLWYNGAWFQGNTKYWTNYPSSTNPNDEYTPVMWRGWLGAMTTIYGLANLKAA